MPYTAQGMQTGSIRGRIYFFHPSNYVSCITPRSFKITFNKDELREAIMPCSNCMPLGAYGVNQANAQLTFAIENHFDLTCWTLSVFSQ